MGCPSFPVADVGEHGVPGGGGLGRPGEIVVALGGGVAAMAEQRGGEADLCRPSRAMVVAAASRNRCGLTGWPKAARVWATILL